MNLQSFHLHARNLTAITTSIPLNATSYSCGQCATRAVAGLFSAMLGQRESQCLLPMQPLSKDLKQGLALLADTDEAREKMREMSERRRRIPQRLGPAVTIEDTVDLGVDITERELSGAA